MYSPRASKLSQVRRRRVSCAAHVGVASCRLMKMMTLPRMLLLLPMRVLQVTFDFTMLGGVPVRTP